jgi:hypothetical protein
VSNADRCFYCNKADAPPSIVSYLNPNGSAPKHIWAHPMCMPVPEMAFAQFADMQR